MKLFLLGILLVSCSMPTDTNSIESNQALVSIINWNLQTFFDAQTVGTEYNDYQDSKTRWSETRYKERLKTLCNFIEKTQADVYVFQEIENSSILQDIANELSSLYSIKKGFGFSAFSKRDDEALGIAILSRYPLENVSAHQIDLQTALGLSKFETSTTVTDGSFLEQPSMRAILHATIKVNSYQSFSLYACHWKSKYGGAEKSEVWRNAQERLLANLLIENKEPYLVTGDFNRNLNEFINSDGAILLRGDKSSVSVLSSWLEFQRDNSLGSYYYQGQWEKIDHFFYAPIIEIVEFQAIKNELTVTEEGLPYRYDLYNGKGTSDHLPLLCIVELWFFL